MTSSTSLPNGTSPSFNPALHSLLLLSDSALPLGSFAFSSGLESFLAHKGLMNPYATHATSHNSTSGQGQSQTQTKLSALHLFLEHSIHNTSSTLLPYVLSACHSPGTLQDLDNDLDASTPCTVARRASVTQGRALLQIWERALVGAVSDSTSTSNTALSALTSFITTFKSNIPVSDSFGLNIHLQAHFAPLFGAVCSALSLSAHETAYLFLLNHAKTVLSAGVRANANIVGSYQSQAILASQGLQGLINECVERQMRSGVGAEDAVVTVPTMDLWMGRHEKIYSRVFNS